MDCRHARRLVLSLCRSLHFSPRGYRSHWQRASRWFNRSGFAAHRAAQSAAMDVYAEAFFSSGILVRGPCLGMAGWYRTGCRRHRLECCRLRLFHTRSDLGAKRSRRPGLVCDRLSVCLRIRGDHRSGDRLDPANAESWFGVLIPAQRIRVRTMRRPRLVAAAFIAWLVGAGIGNPNLALANNQFQTDQSSSKVTRLEFGTHVQVELLQDLNDHTTGKIENVRLRVLKSVWVGDFIVIAAGAEASGTASMSIPRRGENGEISLRANSAVSVTGMQ